MARVTSNCGLVGILDEIDLEDIDATAPLSASADVLRLSYDQGEEVLELRGAFEYGDGALPSAGVVTGIRLVEEGELEFAIASLDVDVMELFAAMLNEEFDDREDFLEALLDGDDILFGSEFADLVQGGDGDDEMDGEAGDDELDGEAGDDDLDGEAGDDDLDGGRGHDRLNGGRGRDDLDGAGGHDRLVGGSGADLLDGGAGRDFMEGCGGADTFDFNAVADSTRRLCDKIRDFVAGEDLLDLSGIDADDTLAGNQSFDFVGRMRFSGEAGELRCASRKVMADVDGDGVADFVLKIQGERYMDADDMLL